MGVLALLAGQMAVQGNVGGGSFVCGLRRVLSEHHTLEFQGALGECPSVLSSMRSARWPHAGQQQQSVQ